MPLTLVTSPTIEPVSTAEAKLHLRVDTADDDTLISRLIAAARRTVERDTGHALLAQTWDLVLDRFPSDTAIVVPLAPLRSVTNITYIDAAGVVATLASNAYLVDMDSVPGRVVPASGANWPSFTQRPTGAVRVRFVAGFGPDADAVPAELVQALLLLVGHWYETREAVVGTSGATVGVAVPPLAYDSLILDYRMRARRF